MITDIIVIGAGPAGLIAALRAADLGARTVLVTRAEFGGMAANDGPVPVRTLAQAARLIREARQLGQYGIGVGEPVLDYSCLLARVHQVVGEVRAHSSLRAPIEFCGSNRLRTRRRRPVFRRAHTLSNARADRGFTLKRSSFAPAASAGGSRCPASS